MEKKVTFAEAIAYFERIGFQVTPGPRRGEVSLTLDQGDALSTTVWPEEMLQTPAGISRPYRHKNALLRVVPALAS